MTSIPAELSDALHDVLDARIVAVQALSGGCIANASRLETSRGLHFLKWSAGDAGDTFEAEARGLHALRAAHSPLIIPDVHAVGSTVDGHIRFLVMEFIHTGAADEPFWRGFGEDLAELHRCEGAAYGLEGDNFIGRLPQENDPEESWPAFYARRRLLPQKRIAEEGGRWRHEWEAPFDRLLHRLPEILPDRPERSILHGDLWSGNVLATTAGRAALIDPAAYYGHRETDLAMAELFGGFARRFFDAYRDAWPLAAGYEERRDVYQLYHLINHLNHFGGSYARSIQAILRGYGG